jgi:hypothetical protein
MNNKILIAGGLVVAFLAGIVYENYGAGSARAFVPSEPLALTSPAPVNYPVRRVVSAEPIIYREPAPTRVVEQPVVYQEAPQARRGRSWEREVLIVAGSSGAGAAIGAAAGGGKGAAIGAISGGVAGLIYDMATRNK